MLTKYFLVDWIIRYLNTVTKCFTSLAVNEIYAFLDAGKFYKLKLRGKVIYLGGVSPVPVKMSVLLDIGRYYSSVLSEFST